MTEEWKDIPGYEGRYQASTMGRIRSLDRRVRVVCHGKEATRLMRGRVLRPGKCRTGHVSVVLGNKANGSPVHKLVALTFIGPRPDGCEICHNDGDPTNNAVSNLRYDTRAENNKDITRQGKRHLKIEDIKSIRLELKEGKRGRIIAKKYGVSEQTICAIKNGRAYGWVK